MQPEWYIRIASPVLNSNDLVDQLLISRPYDQKSRSFFHSPSYDLLFDPEDLGGVAAATKRISQAIARQERIAVYGDYDIDGLTATTLLCEVITQLGGRVKPYIPDRFEEGYGINKAALTDLRSQGVQLVISVDCGITSVAEVAHAKKIGLDIIITDHHVPKDVLPQEAIAVINPKAEKNPKVYPQIAGVGVAFALARSLADAHGVSRDQQKWLLDLVALGTVCDSVPLLRDNWLMVRYGLIVLAKTRRVGLVALMEASGVQQSSITTEDLGFRLGPRLNAAGRLEHAKVALNLLMTTDHNHARKLAAKLNTLNTLRQQETATIFDQATQLASDQNRPTIVLAHKEWSHGIVGIVASRLSEKFSKPTILLQILADNTAKGSARSIEDYSIIEGITTAADKLVKFGGHAYAAGVMLQASDITYLHDQLDDHFVSHSTKAGTKKTIDGILAPELVHDSTLLSSLAKLKPFGTDHEEPIFASDFTLVSFRPVGADKKHAQFQLANDSGSIAGIGFGLADQAVSLPLGSVVSVVFRVLENTYNGRSSQQLIVQSIAPKPNGFNK